MTACVVAQEGDNGQRLLYDFLCGGDVPEFHRMMSEGVPTENTMKQIQRYD